MSKRRFIKGHIASAEYDATNPFSLVEWAARCGSLGYTALVETDEEDRITLVRPEDVMDINGKDVCIVLSMGELEDMISSVEDQSIVDTLYEVVIVPVSELAYTNDGSIQATRV